MNFSGQGYFITHLTQFMGFLQNGDEIVGNPGKSEKLLTMSEIAVLQY